MANDEKLERVKRADVRTNDFSQMPAAESQIPSPPAADKLVRVEQHPERNADNVDNIPSVGLSSFDGVSVADGKGVALDGDFRVAPADRDLAPGKDDSPQSSAVIKQGMGPISRKDATWSKAKLPGANFTQGKSDFEGVNPAEHQPDGDANDRSRGQAPFNKGSRGMK